MAWPSRFSIPCLVLLQAAELDLGGKLSLGHLLDPILHRRRVVAQHVQAGAVGHDLDLDILAFARDSAP